MREEKGREKNKRGGREKQMMAKEGRGRVFN
jgi:hypothetical protein